MQKWITLTTAQLAYCTSNHQQGHGINHSCHKIILFLQQPHLRSSIQIQTWSLYLGHAASNLPTMVEPLNIRHEIRTISLDTSRAYDTVWHPALFSKLPAYGIQSQLQSWITDFHPSRRRRVALNGTISSPLPVMAGIPQGSVLGPILFLIFINDLTDSLENPLYLFADYSTVCHDISHPSDRQTGSSLFPLLRP